MQQCGIPYEHLLISKPRLIMLLSALAVLIVGIGNLTHIALVSLCRTGGAPGHSSPFFLLPEHQECHSSHHHAHQKGTVFTVQDR